MIGRTLELNHQSLTIIGVMPLRFTFTETVGNVDAYVPWSPARSPALLPWIKLRRGVTVATANEKFWIYLKQFKLQSPLAVSGSLPRQCSADLEAYITWDQDAR